MDDSTTTDHRHHQHHKPSNDPVSTQSSSSSLNTHHKSRAARIDDQSRRNKVLSRSVIADSLHYFLPKPNPNPTLIRTVSDSTKMSQPNPDKERWRRKFYGGEIVKLIYEKKSEKKAASKAEEEEEVEMRLAKMDVSEVRKGGDGDIKRVSRRRSFCGEETSLSSFLSSNGARIVAVDMPPFMQIHAIDCARKAYDSLEKFTSKSLALSLKKEFDGVYGPAWHCIVGTSFGSFVTHSVGGFLYFSLDHKMYILLFKTTVQRAD